MIFLTNCVPKSRKGNRRSTFTLFLVGRVPTECPKTYIPFQVQSPNSCMFYYSVVLTATQDWLHLRILDLVLANRTSRCLFMESQKGGCFRNSTFIVLKKCQNHLDFESIDSSAIFAIFLHLKTAVFYSLLSCTINQQLLVALAPCNKIKKGHPQQQYKKQDFLGQPFSSYFLRDELKTVEISAFSYIALASIFRFNSYGRFMELI